jgi:hypothetical protein
MRSVSEEVCSVPVSPRITGIPCRFTIEEVRMLRDCLVGYRHYFNVVNVLSLFNQYPNFDFDQRQFLNDLQVKLDKYEIEIAQNTVSQSHQRNKSGVVQ